MSVDRTWNLSEEAAHHDAARDTEAARALELAGPAIERMDQLGLSDDEIMNRLNQGGTLAACRVPEGLVIIISRVAATRRFTNEDVRMIVDALKRDSQ